MPRKGRSNEEIIHAQRQVEGGEKVAELCRIAVVIIAQGDDAAAFERKILDQQRLDEARRALEARAETRDRLRQKLAEIERARAQIEEAQQSVAPGSSPVAHRRELLE
jgi:hypothetical protein